MSGHDFLFYVLALTAVAAALASALRADLRDAASATLVVGVALTGLLELAAAPLVATLVGLGVFAGYAARQRQPGNAEPAPDAAASLPDRLRSAALVAGFLVVTLRAVLIVSWPLAETPKGLPLAGMPAVGLTHYVVLALVLLAIGLFAAISRRTIAGVVLGLASSTGGVVLALGSASRFSGESGEAAGLAAIVIVFSAATGIAAVRLASGSGDLVRSSETAWKVAGSLAAVLAGVSFALLATAW